MKTLALSAKVRYGILALIELAAIHGQESVLPVAEIAQRQQIPDRYLEQMLSSLRRAGILRSIRGPRGGYQLNRPPAQVPLQEVVLALEGESTGATSEEHSAEAEVLAGLEQQLNQARRSILAKTTLQDLLDQRNQRIQAQVMYFI